jgi:hypothetical protein
MLRGYNYRIHHKERLIKKRILCGPYSKRYYEKYHIGRSRRRYTLNRIQFYRPEDKWFNYIGEYSNYFKEKTNSFCNSHHGDDIWKDKYDRKRSRAKEKIRKKINDEIGDKYYFIY